VSQLTLGNNIQINPNTSIYGNVIIGNNVMIAPNCMIAGRKQGIKNIPEPMITEPCTSKRPIVIEDDVWIAANSLILHGIRIGSGSVIGGGEC